MICLRELQLDDVQYMYEFISDEDISSNFKFTRYPMSRENLIDFVRNSWSNKKNINFAIIDEGSKEYVGTISLKNINYIDKNAEYAIVIRKKFWGKDYAFESTKKILEYGFNRLNLHKIYLNVLEKNVRANKFYLKFGFVKEAVFQGHVYIDGKYENLIWYYLIKEKYNDLF